MDQERAKKLFSHFKELKDVLISKKNPDRMRVYVELGNLLKQHENSGASLADLMKEGGAQDWKIFDVDGREIAEYLLKEYEKLQSVSGIELPTTINPEQLKAESGYFETEARTEQKKEAAEKGMEEKKREGMTEEEKKQEGKTAAEEAEKKAGIRQEKIDALKILRQELFSETELMETLDRANSFYGYVKENLPEARFYDGWHVLMGSSASAKNQENMSTGNISLEGDIPAPYSTKEYMKAERMRNAMVWLERMGKKEELVQKMESELEEESPEKTESLLMFKIAHGEDVYMETVEKKNSVLENSDRGEESEKIYQTFLQEWTNPELQKEFQKFKKEWRGATYRDAIEEKKRLFIEEEEQREAAKHAREATQKEQENKVREENILPEDDNELPTPRFPMR